MTGDTAAVELLGAPVRLWATASERYHDLLRELRLLQYGHDGGHAVPARLLQLSEDLTGRYASLMAANNAQRDAALLAGEERIDLHYEVPTQVRPAVVTFMGLLEEVDEYCRSDQMLTLATPPAQREFRAWFLGQFVAQIDGAAPQPWEGPLQCPVDDAGRPGD